MPDIDFERITVNMIPTGDLPVFHASQYETARPFIADLKWGDEVFTPGEGCWAEVDIRKVDGNIIVLVDDVTIDGNTVSVVLPQQAVTCIGKNLGQIKVYGDDDVLIGSLNFFLEVQPDPLAGGVDSETAIDNLTSQIEEIAQEVIGEDYYNKTEVDALLADKADVSDLPDMSNYYTKSETYNKTEVDNALALKANSADLATVATTGDYDDLLNKPSIPAAQVQSDYAQADNTQVDYIKNKPDISGMIAAAIDNILPVVSDSGALVTINVGLERTLKAITVDPLATQVTRCGVNLFDITKHNENPSAIFTLNADGSLSVENPNNWAISINWEYTGLLPSGTYTIKNLSEYAFYVQFAADDYSHSVAANGSYTFSYDGSGYLNVLPGNIAANTTKIFKIQIESGSAFTAYDSYNGAVYPVADIGTITTLNGVNNIFADAGDVSVSAYDSIQHYIDNQ